MWERKILKRHAKGVFRKHYWSVIFVCLVLAFFTSEYGNTLDIVHRYDENKASEVETVQSNNHDAGINNAEVVGDLIYSNREESDTNDSRPTKGVFAYVFNNVTDSGSFIFGVLDSVGQIISSGSVEKFFVGLLSALIGFLWWFLIKNILVVGGIRFFQEKSTYEKADARTLLMPFHVGKVWNVAKIMCIKSFCLFLWAFTIIGWFIKFYSYMMVPYILAENPSADKKQAFSLSRSMMKGNKWKAFLLDLSFLPWYMLDVLTLGLLRIFYVNPYLSATRVQFYKTLRAEAFKNKIPGCEEMNDRFLFEHPAEYSAFTGTEILSYPSDLFTIPAVQKKNWVRLDYMRKYSIWNVILLFFTFSIVGWLWEVSLHLSTDGFVNRGVLQGPWLPIYGTGGVLVLVLLQKVRKNPGLTFLLTVVVCGAVEYFTSWYLWETKHTKWWDYSGYFLNLNGRICAEGLLVFGLGGCAFIYVLAPALDDCYNRISLKIRKMVCITLLLLFVLDQGYSHFHPNMGKGITDYDEKAAVRYNADPDEELLILLKNPKIKQYF